MADLTPRRQKPILLSDSVDATAGLSPDGGLPEELHHPEGRIGARYLALERLRGLSHAYHLRVTDELVELQPPGDVLIVD